jgi:hypothetical protein
LRVEKHRRGRENIAKSNRERQERRKKRKKK